MRSPEAVYGGSFLLSAVITAAVMPLWRKFAPRVGLVDEPGVRKIHAKSIPLAGGLGLFSGLCVSLLVLALLLAAHVADPLLEEQFRYGLVHRSGRLLAFVFGGLGMLSLGLVDDRYELSAGIKLFGQALIAFLVAASGIRITLFVPSIVFSYAVTILWIVALINAFNFVDNMNGLCGGLAAIASLLFGLSAALRGDYLVGGLAFLCAGAFCGFLPYNFPRASVFLGDSGSHLAGFIVAMLAILPHYYSPNHPRAVAVITPILVLALPLIDVGCVVISRWRSGRPIYVGDNNHLSHRLVRAGFSSVQAVLILWFLASVVGAVSLLL